MPGRSSRKAVVERRARALAMFRLWLIGAALVLVASLVFWELMSTGGGAELRSALFGPRDLNDESEALNGAIDASLVGLGVLRVTSSSEERESRGGVWTHWEKNGVIPYGLGSFHMNAELTEAVRAAGGEILRVRETGPDWRGSVTIDVRAGVHGVETHRIVLREAHSPTDALAEREEGVAPRIALVIDDLGYRRGGIMERLRELDLPLAVSVLPGTPYAEELAREATEAGLEVLVHLPMEPAGYPEVDPGDGALLLDHSHWEIRGLTNEALESIPGATGVNNHMGSAFTRDRAKMSTVIAAVSSHGMFYLDSMTTPESRGFAEARRQGVAAVRNNMFVDSPLDEEGRIDVYSQLTALEETARKRGYAVGIGHPYPETLEALSAEVKELAERGIEFVFVSEIAE